MAGSQATGGSGSHKKGPVWGPRRLNLPPPHKRIGVSVATPSDKVRTIVRTVCRARLSCPTEADEARNADGLQSVYGCIRQDAGTA